MFYRSLNYTSAIYNTHALISRYCTLYYIYTQCYQFALCSYRSLLKHIFNPPSPINQWRLSSLSNLNNFLSFFLFTFIYMRHVQLWPTRERFIKNCHDIVVHVFFISWSSLCPANFTDSNVNLYKIWTICSGQIRIYLLVLRRGISSFL